MPPDPHRSTVCDHDPLEKQYGHSLSSSLVNFPFKGIHVHLVDTPGMPDFAGQSIAAAGRVQTVLREWTRNERRAVIFDFNGNNMKFRRTSDLRLDEQWKAKLGEAERRYFEERAGALNRRFGYV